jgi:hypothetical protein
VDNIPKLLKGFVIAGGVALIAGTALLLVMIVMRASTDRAADPSAGTPLAADRCGGGTPSSQPLSVPLPAGARIEQIVPDGNCLMLLGVDGDGRQFVALVDPLTGKRISMLLLRPEP